eukprot:scaffold3460_cov115-Isochrysis_galbana.AAC.13
MVPAGARCGPTPRDLWWRQVRRWKNAQAEACRQSVSRPMRTSGLLATTAPEMELGLHSSTAPVKRLEHVGRGLPKQACAQIIRDPARSLQLRSVRCRPAHRRGHARLPAV